MAPVAGRSFAKRGRGALEHERRLQHADSRISDRGWISDELAEQPSGHARIRDGRGNDRVANGPDTEEAAHEPPAAGRVQR